MITLLILYPTWMITADTNTSQDGRRHENQMYWWQLTFNWQLSVALALDSFALNRCNDVTTSSRCLVIAWLMAEFGRVRSAVFAGVRQKSKMADPSRHVITNAPVERNSTGFVLLRAEIQLTVSLLPVDIPAKRGEVKGFPPSIQSASNTSLLGSSFHQLQVSTQVTWRKPSLILCLFLFSTNNSVT